MASFRAAHPLVILAAVLVLVTLPVSQASAITPCCEITSLKFGPVDGIVTAVDKATGRTFDFSVSSALLKTLRIGQAVYAEFGAGKVSINGFGPVDGIGPIHGFGPVDGIITSPGQQDLGPVSKYGPVDGDLPGIRMQLQELKRVGNSVTLKFKLFNVGSAPFSLGYNFGGSNSLDFVYLIDPLTNTKYAVLNAAGCVCSSYVPAIARNSSAVLWAKFTVPAEVQRATVVIPRFTPLEEVPITR